MQDVWHAKFVVSPRPMKQHEWWRELYRKNRYGRHLTQRELNQRFRDILGNILVLTPEAKVGFPPVGPAGSQWMELMTHVLEEFYLRHGPYPAGFTRDIHQSD